MSEQTKKLYREARELETGALEMLALSKRMVEMADGLVGVECGEMPVRPYGVDPKEGEDHGDS